MLSVIKWLCLCLLHQQHCRIHEAPCKPRFQACHHYMGLRALLCCCLADDGPMTANDIIIHVEQQLQQQGLADSCASMFLGCNLLFITPSTNQQASAVAAGAVTPTIAAAAAASSTPAGVVGSVQVKAEPDITSTIMPAAPSGLLSGVWDAVSVAMQWRMKAALQQVENIKLQVMSVFGTVHRSSNM